MTKQAENTLTLAGYIAQVGEKKFAEEHGLTIRQVQSYRYGARRPSLDVAKRIVQSDKNPLTWDHIYAAAPRSSATRRTRARRRERA